MGLLNVAAASVVVAGAGCYEPELRDCTLTCNAASDCADGQVCGTDGFCAAPGIAGQCSQMPGAAGSADRDAGMTDAKMADAAHDVPPDAATHVPLMISIDGKGRVTVGTETCDESGPQNGSCTFMVPIYAPVTVSATAYSGWRFDRWTTPACAIVPISTCTFTPTTATPVGVKFRKDDD